MTLRSSYSEAFLGKGVLKICSKFTGEHLYRSKISIKWQSNFSTPFQQNTSGWLFLDVGDSEVVVLSSYVFLALGGVLGMRSCIWCFFLLLFSYIKCLSFIIQQPAIRQERQFFLFNVKKRRIWQQEVVFKINY